MDRLGARASLTRFAQLSQHIGDVCRQGRAEFEALARFGVAQREAGGVEGLAVEEEVRVGGIVAKFAAGELRASAVVAVAEHGAADRVEMDANLMRAARFRQHAAQPRSR